MIKMYKTEEFTSDISTKDYLKDFVDIDYFLEFCKNCPHYGLNWGCPPFNFNSLDYWTKYNDLHIVARKISFKEKIRNKTYTSDELNEILSKSLAIEKNKLLNSLMKMENEFENSVSISIGRCTICKDCSREKNEKCINPEKLRHSMESLGANVNKTITEIFNIEMNWIEDYKLPDYLIICAGLLY